MSIFSDIFGKNENKQILKALSDLRGDVNGLRVELQTAQKDIGYIMKTQAEAAQDLRDIKVALVNIGTVSGESLVLSQKSADEIKTLQETVQKLTDAINSGGNVSDEVATALEDVKAQLTVTTASVNATKESVKAADDLVPDVTVEPPPAPEPPAP